MLYASHYLFMLICVTCCMALTKYPGTHDKFGDMYADHVKRTGKFEMVGCHCPALLVDKIARERCAKVSWKERYLPVTNAACYTPKNIFYYCTDTGLEPIGCCDNLKLEPLSKSRYVKTSGYYYLPDGVEYRSRRVGLSGKGTVTCSPDFKYTYHRNIGKPSREITTAEPVYFDLDRVQEPKALEDKDVVLERDREQSESADAYGENQRLIT